MGRPSADAIELFRQGIAFHADGNIDKAIVALQAAQAEPTLRVACLHLLGQCFLEKGWHQEAVDTFHVALDSCPDRDHGRRIELAARLEHAMNELNRKW